MGKKLFKKAGSVIAAAVLAVGCSAVAVSNIVTSVSAETVKYEFENGTITGKSVIPEAGSERYSKGASGDKFVFIEDAGDTAAVTVNVAEAGMYEITLCYSAPYGNKIHNWYVNGVDQGDFSCAKTKTGEWVEVSLGAVKLNAGDNEISVKSSWGWTNLDYITLSTAELPPISASQITCCDKSATKETQNLMSYLASVYGKNIISGQQEIYQYGPHDFEYEFDFLENLTGKLPAIRGFDYLNCNPLYGYPLYNTSDGTTDRIINWVKNKNGIATSSWHINVPIDMTNYTVGEKVDYSQSTYSVWKEGSNNTIPATNFDTANVLIEGTKENQYYMLALKYLAEEISKLQDANVPLIFRPLHEAEGGGGENGSWFWWGKDGSAVYKELWKLTYKTLTEDYGLHNIIWEWNSYAFSTSADWYPGDEYVDLIAYDKYNCKDSHNDSAISSTFYTIMQKFSSKKMVAMAENDSIPKLSKLIEEKAGWLYFCPWYDGGSDNTNFVTNEFFNRKKDLIEMYQSDYCITLDELPKTLYSEESEVPTFPTQPTESTKPTDPTQPSTSDEFVFENKSYPIELTKCGEEGAKLSFTIKGEPTASIGGGLGYAVGKDWEKIEWSGNADEDGNLVVEIDLSEIPSDAASAEIQIWWSNVWDSVNEVAIDKDCELAEYTEIGKDTPTSSSTEASTDEKDDIIYGDVNHNGDIDISDAAKIMSYVSNSQKYPLTEEEINIADVNQRGDGIGGMDALAVQKKLAQIITELPESYLE